MSEPTWDYWVGSNIICYNPRKVLATSALKPKNNLSSYNWGFLQLLIKSSSTQYIPDVGLSTHTLIRFWGLILGHHNKNERTLMSENKR